MKQNTTYILHSKDFNKYYVGYTSMKISDRLRKHMTNHRGYTGRANDWKVVYTKCFSEKLDLMKRKKASQNSQRVHKIPSPFR